jgi:hypothetical protein
MAEVLAGSGPELAGTAAAPAEPKRGDARTWSFGKKVGFRWLFSFIVLFASPFPIDLLDVLSPGAPWVGDHYGALWTPLVTWVGKHLFGVDITWQLSGSGDTTFNYVQVLCFAVVATVATVVWSVLDRKRASYDRLHDWLRLYVRMYLGFAMLSYGFAKIIKQQFPYPRLSRLIQAYGDSSPMGLLWTFMGFSAPYNTFTGGAEALGGILLFPRRTALLGSLVSIGVLSNIVMLNLSYDVPVKLYSMSLLGLAIFLAAPDAQRLMDLFVRNRAVPAVELRPIFSGPRAHRAALVARTAFAALLVFLVMRQSRTMMAEFGDLAPRPSVYGIWNVEEETVDGVAHPPVLTDAGRWRRVVFDQTPWFGIQLMSDQRVRYSAEYDDPKGVVTLDKFGTENDKTVLHYVRPEHDRLELDGKVDGHQVHAVLRLVDTKGFLLLSRGFHWISEYPFNR